MKKIYVRLISAIVTLVFIFSMFENVALASQQIYQNLKQQQDYLQSTISQIQDEDGKDKMALMYDLEGLKLYNLAIEKLFSAHDAKYYGLSQSVVMKLLDDCKAEISSQYVFTCWNISNKLLETKMYLSSYVYDLIESGKCDNESAALLSNALKNFFIADKILYKTSFSELTTIMPNIQDKNIITKVSNMLKIAQQQYDKANKDLSNGGIIESAIFFGSAYSKLLSCLNYVALNIKKKCWRIRKILMEMKFQMFLNSCLAQTHLNQIQMVMDCLIVWN